MTKKPLPETWQCMACGQARTVSNDDCQVDRTYQGEEVVISNCCHAEVEDYQGNLLTPQVFNETVEYHKPTSSEYWKDYWIEIAINLKLEKEAGL